MVVRRSPGQLVNKKSVISNCVRNFKLNLLAHTTLTLKKQFFLFLSICYMFQLISEKAGLILTLLINLIWLYCKPTETNTGLS